MRLILEILTATGVFKIHVQPMPRSGGRFNNKISSYQYRKSHCGDKTILRPSYLHNGISYTDKMTSLYWIRTLHLGRHYRLWASNPCHPSDHTDRMMRPDSITGHCQHSQSTYRQLRQRVHRGPVPEYWPQTSGAIASVCGRCFVRLGVLQHRSDPESRITK